MRTSRNQTYFTASVIFHLLILLVLALGFDFSEPLPIIENTNKNDVISAVVLGDSPKSKILPHQPARESVRQKVKEKPKQNMQKLAQQMPIKKDTISIKTIEKKKQRELFAKDLLADIKKQNDRQKKIKQKKLTSPFEKTLREQAEKSLRQQLLNEEIKLQGKETRQAQGEVNKYKALILQAISQRWIVPTQANKKLYCELMIRVAPGGMVLDVQVTRTSGDPSLDSSARAAVLKASPLPVPTDSRAFAAFRQFVLTVKPENILANDGGE